MESILCKCLKVMTTEGVLQNTLQKDRNKLGKATILRLWIHCGEICKVASYPTIKSAPQRVGPIMLLILGWLQQLYLLCLDLFLIQGSIHLSLTHFIGFNLEHLPESSLKGEILEDSFYNPACKSLANVKAVVTPPMALEISKFFV